MAEQYLRKVQDHGTGKEIRIPPEICEKLCITDGGEIQFDLDPDLDVVTLRKPGTLDNRQNKERPKPVKTENHKNATTILFGDHICIISGKSGSGKMQLVENLCQNCNRFIIYDTLGKYKNGLIFLSLQKLKDFWSRVHKGNFRLIYQPLDPEHEFDSICKVVTEYDRLTFVIENLDWYCKPSISPAFEKIIENSCNYQIQLIGTTQKLEQIDKRLTGQIKQTLTSTLDGQL